VSPPNSRWAMAESCRELAWSRCFILILYFAGPVMPEAAHAKSVQVENGPSTRTVWGKVASWQVKNASKAERVLELGKIPDELTTPTSPTTSTTSQSTQKVKDEITINDQPASASMEAESWQVPREGNTSDAQAAVKLPTTSTTVATSTSVPPRQPRTEAKSVKTATDKQNQSSVALQTGSPDRSNRSGSSSSSNSTAAPAATDVTTTAVPAPVQKQAEPRSWQVPKNFAHGRNRSHELAAATPTATTTTAALTSTPNPTKPASSKEHGSGVNKADRDSDTKANKKAALATSKGNKTATKQNHTGRLRHKTKGGVMPQLHSNTSAADESTNDTSEDNSSNSSGNSSQMQYCRLQNNTQEKRLVGSGGDSLEEKAPKGSYAAGTVAVVSCAKGYGGSRTHWEIKCEENGQWKARHWKGRSNFSLPDCRPVNCSTPNDPLGTWHVHGINETVQLVCADGFVPDSGSPVIPCMGRPVQPARCVPSRGSAEKWRSALQRDALLRLLGAVAVVAVVLVFCWRDPLARLGAQHSGTKTDDVRTDLGDRLVRTREPQAIGLPP